MNILRTLCALVLFVAMGAAHANVQASLDRDHVALGDSVTLTIASDDRNAQPQLLPLRQDFDVRGTSTSSSVSIVNGNMKSSAQWMVTLVPKHAGALVVPALAVGNDSTQALHVDVSDAPLAATSASADASAASGAPVFIETSIAPDHAYVQQAMVYTVRLYYAITLLDGVLDPPTPDNGDLRQIGDDANSTVMMQGHRYNLLERHYLLQPEHSGALHIPAPQFHGRAMADDGGLFDDPLSPGRSVRIAGKPIDVQVRARPAQAGDPWIPASALALSVQPPTAPIHAGEPFTLVVKLDGEGVTAAQLPEIALPAMAGAQVYPEPSSTSEQQRDGQLHAQRTRRFAIVPARPGTLRMPELTVPWWDVVNDRAEVARAALPTVQVLPGTLASGAADGGLSTGVSAGDATGTNGQAPPSVVVLRGWQVATLVLSVLLALSLGWGWQRGRRDVSSSMQDAAVAARPAMHAPTLDRALALGDPAAIAQALIEAAPAPRPRHLGEVVQRLHDLVQRDAVAALDAARWSAGGTLSGESLAGLRAAFKQVPRWRMPDTSASSREALPPLYPS
jgi:hypothetical protein